MIARSAIKRHLLQCTHKHKEKTTDKTPRARAWTALPPHAPHAARRGAARRLEAGGVGRRVGARGRARPLAAAPGGRAGRGGRGGRRGGRLRPCRRGRGSARSSTRCGRGGRARAAQGRRWSGGGVGRGTPVVAACAAAGESPRAACRESDRDGAPPRRAHCRRLRTCARFVSCAPAADDRR